MTDGYRSTTSFQTSLSGNRSDYQDAVSRNGTDGDSDVDFDTSSVNTVDANPESKRQPEREEEPKEGSNQNRQEDQNAGAPVPSSSDSSQTRVANQVERNGPEEKQNRNDVRMENISKQESEHRKSSPPSQINDQETRRSEDRRIKEIDQRIRSDPNQLATFLQTGVDYANEAERISRESRRNQNDNQAIVGMQNDTHEYRNTTSGKLLDIPHAQSSPGSLIANKDPSKTNTENSGDDKEKGEDSSFIKDKELDHDKLGSGKKSWLMDRLYQELDPNDTTFQLACQAALTGYIDIVVYTKSNVWSGYITGTMVQFAQNIAQFMLPNAATNPLLTLERAIVILSFFLGSLIGNQIGNQLGHKSRHYLIFTTLLQSLLLWGASGIVLSRPEAEGPTFTWWPPIMMFCALSFGMQSIAGQKMISPAFATTVAFTATISQIASDPYLFVFSLKPTARKNTAGRNRRLIAIISLMTGAGVGEMIQYTSIGTQGALAVGAAAKIVLALLWFIPSGQGQKLETSKA